MHFLFFEKLETKELKIRISLHEMRDAVKQLKLSTEVSYLMQSGIDYKVIHYPKEIQEEFFKRSNKFSQSVILQSLFYFIEEQWRSKCDVK